jgi:hypothetical protein
VAVFNDERRAKPLRIIFGMFTDPFARSLGQWPNERNRTLRQNPDIAFAIGAAHCLESALASGGSGLIGNSGRKTANVCDKHATETTRNMATDFTAFVFTYFLRKPGSKVPGNMLRESQRALSSSARLSDSGEVEIFRLSRD